MTDDKTPAPATPPSAKDKGTPTKAQTAGKKEEGSFTWFLVKLVIVVLIFRSFIFTSFSIPSQSMMPRLLVGDYLFAAKWPYGFSSRSLPFNLPLIPGRIFAHTPERGDVVIFEHPIDNSDYVKRVIGLPGDTIEVVDGRLLLNGEEVPKRQIEDFVAPITANMPCTVATFVERQADGSEICRYPQFRETLPNGVSYNVLDFGGVGDNNRWRIDPDNRPPVVVPEGQLFLMGDNRDNSLDSRFPAQAGLGIGLVPEEQLVGRASFMVFSTDGSAEWLKPWTWFSATRWNRIGGGI